MRVLIASLCIALVATAPASAARNKAKPSCAKKGSYTVLRAPGVRVFTARVTDEEEGLVRLYACLSANGRKQELADSFESSYNGTSDGFSDVRLAGRYVAWQRDEFDGSCKADCPPNYDQSDETVIVYDVRRERLVRQWALPEFTTYRSRSLALTQRGGLAWLAAPDGLGTTPQLEVLDAGGRRVLDSGNIPATSVRAEISIVSWVRDGIEHFARLR